MEGEGGVIRLPLPDPLSLPREAAAVVVVVAVVAVGVASICRMAPYNSRDARSDDWTLDSSQLGPDLALRSGPSDRLRGTMALSPAGQGGVGLLRNSRTRLPLSLVALWGA